MYASMCIHIQILLINNLLFRSVNKTNLNKRNLGKFLILLKDTLELFHGVDRLLNIPV